jgi:transcriptional regulator with XRE-family HTH domain
MKEALNSSKVRKMLATMNEGEFRYAEIQMSMASDAKRLIDEYLLTQKQFCELLKIKPRQYASYLNGSFNYSLREMALLQCAYMELGQKKAIEKLESEIKSKTTGVRDALK